MCGIQLWERDNDDYVISDVPLWILSSMFPIILCLCVCVCVSLSLCVCVSLYVVCVCM